MRNFWLDRGPRICQQGNPYAEHFGRWYIIKGDSSDSYLYLHRDGYWRVSTYNTQLGEYTGYFESLESAERHLDKFRLTRNR
jgi:hypothetical protein